MNKKGFTLIEIIAVIIIIAVVMLIAVPSVSSIIDSSRKNAYVDIAKNYVDAVKKKISAREFIIKKDGTSYYIPIDLIDIESGNKQSPYGQWATNEEEVKYIALDNDDAGTCTESGTNLKTASSSDPFLIWNMKYLMPESDKTYTKVRTGCISAGELSDAYVIVIYNQAKRRYEYYWASRDETGHKINPTKVEELNVDKIVTSNIPVGTFTSVDKYVYKRSQEGNETSGFKYTTSEFSARTVGPTTKVSTYFPDKSLGTGSYRYALSASEGKRCFIYTPKTDGTIMIIEYNASCSSDVIIPSSIDGKEVSEIGLDSFNGNTAFPDRFVTSVIIPDTVKKIGSRAFYHNKITSLILPNTSITIGSQAFSDNYLREINVTANTILNDSPFTKNDVDDDKAFIYKTDVSGNKDTTTLLGYAGSSKNIVIPEGVKVVGSGAFRGSKIDTLVLPSTLEIIENWAFASNNLKSVNFEDTINLTTIKYAAFAYNQLTTTSNIPATVKTIGNRSFNVNNVKDGSEFVYARDETTGEVNYTTIVSYAGGYDSTTPTKVKVVDIPPAVNNVPLTTINGAAFLGCGITKIVSIPETVSTIGIEAFNSNSIPNNTDGHSPYIYARIPNGTNKYKDDTTKIIGYAGSTKNITIPSSVTTIGEQAFGESGIKKVVLNEGLLKIEKNAFRYCYLTKDLQEGQKIITIPSSVTSIGSGAFCKEVSWGAFNRYEKIVNKTGKGFNWKSITCSVEDTISSATGTISHHLGNIEVTN